MSQKNARKHREDKSGNPRYPYKLLVKFLPEHATGANPEKPKTFYMKARKGTESSLQECYDFVNKRYAGRIAWALIVKNTGPMGPAVAEFRLGTKDSPIGWNVPV